jgi:hypothetical protein
MFGMLFITAFFFSLFIFNVEKHSGRSVAAKQFSIADRNWERSFLNFQPNFPYTGLIHKPGHDGEYMQRLFGKLVQKAHKHSHEEWLDVSRGYFLTYNNFLLLSLQVPMHESNLMHFTSRDPKHYCEFTNNVLDPVKDSDYVLRNETKKLDNIYAEIITLLPDLKSKFTTPKKLYSKYCKSSEMKKEVKGHCKRMRVPIIRIDNANRLNKYFPKFKRTVKTPINIKNCEKLNQFDNIKQMQFANDYADVGIFMFNTASHPEMFSTDAVFDFDSVIDYGIKFLYSGYSTVANHNLLDHPENYRYNSSLSCFKGHDARSFAGRMFIMRGAWAGNYNSGKTSKSCRIDESHSTFKKVSAMKKAGYKLNDKGYLENMAKFFLKYKNDENFKTVFNKVKLKNLRESMFHKYLPKDSLEFKAFKEIIHNVFYGKNKRTYIEQVLEKDYDSNSQLIITDESNERENEYIQEAIPVVLKENIKIEAVESNQENKLEETKENTEAKKGPEASISGQTSEIYVEPKSELEDVRSFIEPNEIPLSKNDRPEIGDVDIQAVRIPMKDPRLLTHIIEGKDVNIRSKPSYSSKDLCGNTKMATNLPVRFHLVGADGDFVRIEVESNKEIITNKLCEDLNIFYIHKKYKKQILDYEVLHIANISGPVTLRSIPGKANSSVLDYEFPSDTPIVIIGKKILDGTKSSNQYIWYKLLRPDGLRGWFYSGKVGQQQKVQVLDE